MSNYFGLPVRSLVNNHIKLEYLMQAGPRLVGLFLAGSSTNLLAESPQVSWQTPFGEYRLLGGHRLWYAPEHLYQSDFPDDSGLQVEKLPAGVRLVGQIEAPTGICKIIEIRLDPHHPALTLSHGLVNYGQSAIELAPWAITQLPLGGVLVLPQGNPSHPNRLYPDRNLVLWPYTPWIDPRLRVKNGILFLDARPSTEPAKWGYLNFQGWVGYAWKGCFFRKRFTPQPKQSHPDQGCNVEFYIKDLYVELETLGPLVCLQPGQVAWHTEIWEIGPVPVGDWSGE